MNMPQKKINIDISGHHVDITPALRTYVEDKFKKIPLHFSNITNIYVTLTIEKKYQQIAEAQINLAGTHEPLFANSKSNDMYASIDTLTSKLVRQVQKHKEQLKDHGDGELL
jgi:putative sigma-54 modulation protein